MTTASTPIPLDTFIADNGLSVGLTQLTARTDGVPNTVPHRAGQPTHWLVTLRCLAKRTSFTFQFSQGSGHKGQPSIRMLVDCAISEASAYHAMLDIVNDDVAFDAKADAHFETQFAKFCAEIGYDRDSRAAERAFRGCIRMWQGLKSILSDVSFRQAMGGDVESL